MKKVLGYREKISSKEAMELEDNFGAKNYSPLPIVIERGEGINVYDPEGNQYYDFLSAYSALNQGHCHPKIVEAMKDQVGKLTLTSRAFYSNLLGQAEEYLCETSGFEKALFMNSGAEAVETALKVCRKWAVENGKIKNGVGKILVATNNFHGRTINIISFSTSKDSRFGFGPFNSGYYIIPYNDTESLELMAADPEVIGFLVEPIQGEAGVVVPDEGYLKRSQEICKKHDILFMADEIQTGLGRTGKLYCYQYEDAKPDILILGKALSGGMMPVSAILANDHIMDSLKPGEHGSTFGGNPLGARAAIESVKVIIEEKLAENSYKRGEYFSERMRNINSPIVEMVRGKGLLNAIVIDEDETSKSAYDICKMLKENGLLAKQTHGKVIRFAPPLIIQQDEMERCCDIIEETILSIKD